MGVLSLELGAVLLELLEGLALAAALALAGHAVRGDERLQAELDRDRHQVRVLCYLLVESHGVDQLCLLVVLQKNASCLFDPDDLRSRLLVRFYECAAGDQQFVLQCLPQVAWTVCRVLGDGVRRVKERGEVLDEGHEEHLVGVLSALVLVLPARDHSLDYVLRVLVEVGTDVEKAAHDAGFLVELEADELQVRVTDVVRRLDLVALELSDLLYLFVDLLQGWQQRPVER